MYSSVSVSNPSADVPNVLLEYHNLHYTLKLTEKQASRQLTTVPAVLWGTATAPFRAIYGLLSSTARRNEKKLESIKISN